MYCIIFENNTVHGIKKDNKKKSVRYYEKIMIIVGMSWILTCFV